MRIKRKSLRIFIFIFFQCILVIFLSSCIEYFIYRQIKYSSKTLNENQIEVFKKAKSVQLILNQSFTDLSDSLLNKDLSTYVPLEDVIKDILRFSGLRIVSPNLESPDITIEINAEYSALSSEYIVHYNDRKIEQYSGAKVNGEISISLQSKEAISQPFEGYFKPPIALYRSYETSDEAPYIKSLGTEKSLINRMLKLVIQIYGYNYIINSSLNCRYPDIRANSISILGELNNLSKAEELEVMQTLITSLDDKDYNDVVGIAVLALINRTKNDFYGRDNWKKWWEENKEKYLLSR